ncbi:EscU/YscU/HrcU family type III secretion system export apparatus switch protein [Anaerobium acetethylicum]|uniref:Flagellar biosynthesis protein n=1 Tax=Anaerobium acetethylicum TaxID=1619234 RepID=A0A1D3TPW9_9FIRM|nr:EscU/YscU/HrcU family type III secretion system export apparatus switch protein [Anaerobium acetethylicum]SCP95435.1 flagellar biosynthesis protein [Anaerobium acetethylicum]
MKEKAGKRSFEGWGSQVESVSTGQGKTRQAVALGYDPDDQAPKIIAAGRGILADKIIEKAREENVPLHKDEKLAKTLGKLEIGDLIPPELYEAVAEILVFVDDMDRIRGKLSDK